MDFEDAIVKGFSSPSSKFCISTEFNRTIKSSELAQQIRDVGNKMYTKCNHNASVHEKIWDSYLCSKALAPKNSEALATAYSNMSVLLFHLCKYEDCIKDVDRALKISTSFFLKVKLLCRKAKCLAALGSSSETDSLLGAAKNCLKEISDEDNNKEELSLLIIKAEVSLENSRTNLKIHSSSFSKDDNKKERKEESINEHLEILALKEVQDIFSLVVMSHSDTYGRHLIATRDIRPGEIIFVAKPYIIVPNFKKRIHFCNNCLKVVWSGIPCDNCACAMYCSEECQEEALLKFHDIECMILQFVLLGDSSFDYQIQSSIRAVIMAVKEYGSIANLKEEISNIDSCTDANKGHSYDQKFFNGSFSSLFGFKNIFVEPATLDYLAKSCCRAVIALAKLTSFFGNDSQLDTVEHLINNQDAVFIGSLLLKVSVIIHNNGIKVTDKGVRCKNNADQTTCTSNIPCCERGYSLNTLNQLFPHSCAPNVKSIKTEACKDLLYALQPIYKGDPLLECYRYAFYELELNYRYETTAQVLNYNCECVACVENWPAVLVSDGEFMSYEKMLKTVVESREHTNQKRKFLNMMTEHGLSHQKIVNELTRILEASYDYFGQPSAEVCAAICMLNYAFDELYGLKMDMRDTCRTIKT